MVLRRDFYERDTLTVARDLLGKFIVHETGGETVIGKIVETEAYVGPEDKASHAYGNRCTEATKVQFGPKGYAYIYQIYGMYFCFDVTSGRFVGKPEAVLVRALEPISGLEIMRQRRKITESRIEGLTNGPSKLCTAMGISKKQYGADLCASVLHIDTGVKTGQRQMIQTTKVNVRYADEWAHMPWRFYVKNNDFVSKPNLYSQRGK